MRQERNLVIYVIKRNADFTVLTVGAAAFFWALLYLKICCYGVEVDPSQIPGAHFLSPGFIDDWTIQLSPRFTQTVALSAAIFGLLSMFTAAWRLGNVKK
jgi:hypothetical protein